MKETVSRGDGGVHGSPQGWRGQAKSAVVEVLTAEGATGILRLERTGNSRHWASPNSGCSKQVKSQLRVCRAPQGSSCPAACLLVGWPQSGAGVELLVSSGLETWRLGSRTSLIFSFWHIMAPLWARFRHLHKKEFGSYCWLNPRITWRG